MKVIHHGLRDDVVPTVEAPLLTSHCAPEVSQMLSEGHSTELGRYIKEKDEKHYKRHQQEPLGRAMIRGHTLPDATKDSSFAFGVASQRSECGTKELIEIDPALKVQSTFSRLPLRESMNAQKEVNQKRDYHYNWKALGVDPEAFVFGKAPKEDTERTDTVADSLRFEEAESTRGAEKPQAPMPEDFVYGLPPRNNDDGEWGVSECIHSDVEEKRNVLRRDREQKQNTQRVVAPAVPSRLDPNRITSGHLVNPSKYSQIGVHPEDFKQHRSIEDILEIHRKAGYPVADQSIPEIKELLASKYGGVCSLENFDAALQSL